VSALIWLPGSGSGRDEIGEKMSFLLPVQLRSRDSEPDPHSLVFCSSQIRVETNADLKKWSDLCFANKIDQNCAGSGWLQ
jgi:hypothetical protein